jgi:hypothetical protein
MAGESTQVGCRSLKSKYSPSANFDKASKLGCFFAARGVVECEVVLATRHGNG